MKEVFVLEWCGLDDNIDLYPHKTAKKEISEIYEELNLHNFSNALIMEEKQFKNFLKAVILIISKLKPRAKKKAELTPAQEEILLEQGRERDYERKQEIAEQEIVNNIDEEREATADLHRKYDYDNQEF